MIPRIGLDVDGVVYNWVDTCKDIFLADLGLPLDYWDNDGGWGNPQWMDNTLPQWVYYYEHIYKFFFEGQPYDGALEGVQKLKALTDNLTLLTVVTPEASEARLAWLDKWNVDYDDIVIVKQGELHMSKQKKSETKCDVYIDDAPHHIDDLVTHVPNADVILFDRWWNRAENDLAPQVTDYIRVFDWDELVNTVRAINATFD